MTKVLIVDGDAFVRLAVRTILTSYGLEVVGEADAGDQVLAVGAEHYSGVVLIGLEMPRASGFETIAQVQALPDYPRSRF